MKAYERDHEITKLGSWVLAGVLLLILVVGVYLGSGWYYLREKAEAAYQECLVYDTVLGEVLGTADAVHQDGLAALDSGWPFCSECRSKAEDDGSASVRAPLERVDP